MADQIAYSAKYFDDIYEYRYIALVHKQVVKVYTEQLTTDIFPHVDFLSHLPKPVLFFFLKNSNESQVYIFFI